MIYVMTHKEFSPPPDPFYVPLHVGRKGKADLGYLGDDTGEHISEKNPYYSELTGVYWVWKNRPADEIIGICHYRRFLLTERGTLFSEEEARECLKEKDVITTRLLTLQDTYFNAFHGRHNNHDLMLCREAMERLCPEYVAMFDEVIHDVHTYFGNMVLMKGELFRRYCRWLFPILFETEKSVCMDGYDNYQKRLYGFLSEVLLYVYIKKNHLRVLECMVGMMGEKAETREIKERIGEYFKQRDIAGAKEYFLREYARRPDILMEASDTFGELKLCMQMISTGEYEQDRYGKNFLADFFFSDFSELIHHFQHINELIRKIKAGEDLAEAKAYLQEHHVTDECVRIAAQLQNVDDAQILEQIRTNFPV